MFDVNPRLVGLVVRGVEIRGIEDLEQFIKDNEVQIAALTIPKSKAPEIADRLVNIFLICERYFAIRKETI